MKCQKKSATDSIGKSIRFGLYDINGDGKKEKLTWTMLAASKDSKKVLLVCDSIVARRTYNMEENCDEYALINTNWKDTPLRKWLNSDFLNKAFSSSEKSKIKNTSITTGNVKTKDKVFILSNEEYQFYWYLIKVDNGSWWLRDIAYESMGYVATESNSMGCAKNAELLFQHPGRYLEDGTEIPTYIMWVDESGVVPAIWVDASVL